MRKIYKKLTEEQLKRGVIFSSCLSEHTYETSVDTIHEVTEDTENRDKVIDNLIDDKFFNGSHWKYNIIRNP